MKVGIIINYNLSEQESVGHMDVLMAMFNNLLTMFEEVHVFSMHDSRADYNLGKGIFVHPMPGNGILGMFRNALLARKIIRREKIGVIRVMATTKSAFVAEFATLFMKVPIILSVHVHRTLYQKQSGIALNPAYNFFVELWERAALWRADLVPVISYFIRDYVAGLGASPSKITLHRNFVDTGLFVQDRKPHKGMRMVFVSRLVGAKGVDILLQSFKIANKKHPELELYVAGDGPDKPNLEELSRKLGISNKVKFLGAVKHEKLPELFGECDFFAAASQAGFVLNEALSCGLPVLAADIEWTKEIISDTVGVLVPFGSAEVFAEGIGKMVSRRAEWPEMGRAGRELAVKELSIESYKKRELELYKKVLHL
ncbi:glycosyltransferase family 4 protein [Candidatus Micrarchaeota archaeon]|nr:glycosyltransferase family 4 protein [Candidatus Micrarchaeota archaeon]